MVAALREINSTLGCLVPLVFIIAATLLAALFRGVLLP